MGAGIGAGVTQAGLRAINERRLLAGLREQEQAAEARRLPAALAQRALHDDLTTLPNRALFHDRPRQRLLTAGRDGTAFALLFLDLDGFEAINDRLEHQADDVLLQQVAGRLRGTLRASDTAARLGGDEFAVLLREVAGMPDVGINTHWAWCQYLLGLTSMRCVLIGPDLPNSYLAAPQAQ